MNRLLHELLRWQRTAPANRWRNWARALTDRYAHLVGHFPRPGMVLVPASVPGERHQHLHWSVRRDLHLAVRPVPAALSRTVAVPAAGAAASPRTAPGRQAVTSVPRRVETPAPPLERVVASAAALQADADDPVSPYPRHALLVDTCLRTLERVVQQRQRIEQWARPVVADGAWQPATTASGRPAGGPPAPAPPATAPLAPPRAAVLVTDGGRAGSPASPAGSPASPGTTPATAAPGGPGPGWGGAAPREAAPAAIDIGQLTDQVVRHIDREIVAHRERMGRI
jgi:hypothetical protein